MISSGSSPRVRGTRPRPGPRRGRYRFIPARAGNAGTRCNASWSGTVHPRACGERASGGKINFADFGSSPRVRGTRRRRSGHRARSRFIPARAGNALASLMERQCRPVHPRACGERLLVERHECMEFGSSPRVRGTRVREHPQRNVIRFIPARAGNAHRQHRLADHQAVYPRACGERVFHLVLQDGQVGSSPRVRGTLMIARRLFIIMRFIPARAGNAGRTMPRPPRLQVHPRACGERTDAMKAFRHVSGSSPRVRGTLVGKLYEYRRIRFIPARAGNASATRSRRTA